MPSFLITMNYAFGEPCVVFCGSRSYWTFSHFFILNIIALGSSFLISTRHFSYGLALGSMVGWNPIQPILGISRSSLVIFWRHPHMMTTSGFILLIISKDSDIFCILTTGNPKISQELVSMPSYMTVVESSDRVRIVVFSGGNSKNTDDLLDEIRQIKLGGGNGSIIGRNTFQRPKDEAISLLKKIIAIYKNE